MDHKVIGRVLHVEDRKDWIREVQLALEGRYDVHAATSLREAASLFGDYEFDLVIVDIDLISGVGADEEGFRLVDALQKSGVLPGSRVIVLSAYAALDERLRRAFRDYEVWDFIPKDSFDPEELKREVAEAIRSSTEQGLAESNGPWERWRLEVESALQQKGLLASDELKDIPERSLGDLLAEYLKNHPDEDLVIFNEGKSIQYRRLREYTTVLNLFDRLLDAEGPAGEEVVEVSQTMLAELASLFSFRVPADSKWRRCSPHALMAHISVPILFESLRFPDPLPLVFLWADDFDDSDADHLRETLLQTKGRIAFVVLLSKDMDLHRSLDLLSDRLRGAYAFDLIFFNRQAMRRLLVSRDLPQQLSGLVLSQVNLTNISPFVVTGSTPDHMFFGREKECREIVEHASEVSFAVIGGRRVGKTSLLNRLHRIHLPKLGFNSIYHDCSPTPSYEALLNCVAVDWQPRRASSEPVRFRELLHPSSKAVPIVLLLDETDRLIANDRANDWHLFRELRALTNIGCAQVVLSGERSLRDALRDPNGPLFNFADEIALGPLGYRAVAELITHPMKQMGVEFADESATVRRVFDFTSGHPNIVQRLCRRLIELLNEQGSRLITLDGISAVIHDPRFQEEDFLGTYWERATPLEQIISLLMAQDARPCRLQSILDVLAFHGLHPKPQVAKAALERLVDLRCILKRTQAGYAYAVTAFPLVIANTTTAEDLLIVLKSQYLENPMELPE